MNARPSLIVLLLCAAPAWSAGFDIKSLRTPTDALLSSDAGRAMADNVLSWQNVNGGWWKNYDYSKRREIADRKPDGVSGFDNQATYTELRYLAAAYRVTKEQKYLDGFDRGLKFVLDAQYDNGGWPQQVPTGKGYARHVTFNDDAMTNVMLLLKDVGAGTKDFAFVSDDERRRASDAFNKGVECILKAQIRVNGTLTGWCAQHDVDTLVPAKARAYELPSISGSEGVGITMLLMGIENPDDRVKRAVHASAAWFDRSKLVGKKLVRRPMAEDPSKTDTYLIDEPGGETLWARFYDIETNRPYYCDRDGVPKESLAEIGYERRNGYAWVRPFAAKLMAEYPKWAAKHDGASVSK